MLHFATVAGCVPARFMGSISWRERREAQRKSGEPSVVSYRCPRCGEAAVKQMLEGLPTTKIDTKEKNSVTLQDAFFKCAICGYEPRLDELGMDFKSL